MSTRAGLICLLTAIVTSFVAGILFYSHNRESGSSTLFSLLMGGFAVVISWGVLSIIGMIFSTLLYGSRSVTDDPEATEEEANRMRKNAREMLASRRGTGQNKPE